MTTVLEGVEVTLGRLDADWRKFGITVKVWSQRRPGLKSTNEIDPGAANSAQGLLQLVGAAGGACAEYLGERYRDNIDPSVAANLAMKACVEELRLSKEMSKPAGEKLRRLMASGILLKDAERELVERCSWFVNHGQDLTPAELKFIDQVTASLHGRQL